MTSAAESLLRRQGTLFLQDYEDTRPALCEAVQGAKILVIGGGGTIGRAVTKELFALRPSLLHVSDISENGLVEVVRDIRSSLGYITEKFETFVIDCLSPEFLEIIDHYQYDFVLNLAALKHVRSEKDIYSLRRMVKVNVLSV